jgi:hypothetical protein
LRRSRKPAMQPAQELRQSVARLKRKSFSSGAAYAFLPRMHA